MHAEVFLDTNILLYATSTARREISKKRIAHERLAGTGWGVSL